MAKTWLSVLTALFLVGGSVGLFVARWYVVGDGPPGAATWKVALVASGELTAEDASLTISRPLDFRHQHVFDERFQSKELLHHVGRGKDPDRREVVWRRSNPGGPKAFRLSYSFRCLMGMRQPTPGMARLTRELDAPPTEGTFLKPGPRIESDHKEISGKARELAGEGMPARDQVETFFRYVEGLDSEPTLGPSSALQCLRNGSGDSGGKSRLLVALCRAGGIPARLVSGLILVDGREQGLHRWAEAWVHNRWLPACPTDHHFGTGTFPHNYLVLQLGDEEILRARGAQFRYGFVVHGLHDPSGLGEEQPASAAQAFWQKASLYALRPAEQHLVKFLLLLPLGGLIVSIFRTVIGVPTFGTFGPALLGLAFLDPKALRWGLGIFILTVLVGWGIRRLLDRYHLLLVPRVSILLTLIVIFLVGVVVAADRLGVATTQYISLFPLVILTHLVERFWTVEAEDGTAASFKTLLGTIVVSVAASLALSPDAVTAWMFRHPETVGLVLAALFLLGRYTGYRLSELFRFRDLIQEEQPPGGQA